MLARSLGLLSSENEVLMKTKTPTEDLYLDLKTCDTWVAECRMRTGWIRSDTGYFTTLGTTLYHCEKIQQWIEQNPAGLAAGISATFTAKGGIRTQHAPQIQ